MTAPRMTDEALEAARQDVLGELDLSCECADEEDVPEGKHVAGCDQGAAEDGFNAMCFDHDRARRVETEQAAEIERLTVTNKALADVLERTGASGRITTHHRATVARASRARRPRPSAWPGGRYDGRGLP